MQDQTTCMPFHLDIFKFTACFAQEDHLFAKPKAATVEQEIPTIQTRVADVEKGNQLHVMLRGKDPMVGREIIITKGPMEELEQQIRKKRRYYMGASYSGYFGTIRYSSDGLNVYGVHLEATDMIVQVDRAIVVDRL